jgi:hypothetical protein
MELVTKSQLSKRLHIGMTALERKLRDGSLPPPVCGIFPRKDFSKPKAEDKPLWDADACLKAWGRPV